MKEKTEMNKRAGPTLRELREQNKNTAAEVAEALGVAVSICPWNNEV